jgi:hypothetical protein
MPEDPSLRASDEQRERAAGDIREHFAAGRLDEDELDQRVQAAYAARTQGELSAVLADLPKLPATPAQQKAELVQRRHQLQSRLLQEAGGGLGLFVVCSVIWLASGGHHGHGQFWPGIVLLIVLIPLLRNGWRLYGPAPELDRVERELESKRQRDESKHQLRKQIRSQVRDERRADRYERRRGR